MVTETGIPSMSLRYSPLTISPLTISLLTISLLTISLLTISLLTISLLTPLWLGREPQSPSLAQRAQVESADLDRATDVERDRDAILGNRGRHDARALRQQRGDLGRRHASLRLENAIADDA